MKSAFESIKQGLQEAIAHAKGQAIDTKVTDIVDTNISIKISKPILINKPQPSLKQKTLVTN